MVLTVRSTLQMFSRFDRIVTVQEASERTVVSRGEIAVTDQIEMSLSGDFAAIFAEYPDGKREVVWDAPNGFLHPFSKSQKRGSLFTIERSGGWPALVTIRVKAF